MEQGEEEEWESTEVRSCKRGAGGRRNELRGEEEEREGQETVGRAQSGFIQNFCRAMDTLPCKILRRYKETRIGSFTGEVNKQGGMCREAEESEETQKRM